MKLLHVCVQILMWKRKIASVLMMAFKGDSGFLDCDGSLLHRVGFAFRESSV